MLLVCPKGHLLDAWRDMLSSITRFSRSQLLTEKAARPIDSDISHYYMVFSASQALFDLITTGDISLGVATPAQIHANPDTLSNIAYTVPNGTLIMEAIDLAGSTLETKLTELGLRSIA